MPFPCAGAARHPMSLLPNSICAWFLALLLSFVTSLLSAAPVPVNVRLEGLALGNSVVLRQGGTVVSVSVNGPVTLGQAESGSALLVEILTQPDAQHCALSAQAPAVVPDSAAVFVRCVHTTAARISVPSTLPDDALSWWMDGAGMRSIAYPGLAFESRPGVIGGQFPYEFRLLGARFNGQPLSTAVSLDFRRGTLRFVPSAAGSYAFDLEVRDSAAVQKIAQRTFVITAAADRFLFVAPSGVDAPGRGTINQPFLSIPYALSQGNSAQALMLRAGTYVGRFDLNDARPRQIFAYPDEVPVLAINQTGNITVRFTEAPTARIEGVDITGVRQYGIFSDPARPGLVLRQVRFLDGVVANGSENPAYLHGVGDAKQTRHRFLVQDCEFNNYPSGYATTWFDAGDSIFENNQVRLGASTVGVHDKDNSQRNVYRENFIEYAPSFANNNGVQISAQYGSANVHIHHNLLINTGVLLGGQCLTEGCEMRAHDVHHNTIVNAGLVLRWGVFNLTSRDTRMSHNLVKSSLAPYAWASCLNTVPSAFASQIQARANRLETASLNALRDTECGGSVMNMTWATWRNPHGLDTLANGSEVSTSSHLVGTGALTRLPAGDPRLSALGHRYPLPSNDTARLFGNGFE